MNFEWQLSLANLVWLGVVPVASVALPAWSLRATNMFSDYAPFSWVAAGFVGFAVCALCYFLFGIAYSRWIRARYDRQHLSRSSNVANPMEQTYERKRIFINDFCLPSQPFVHDKTFIDCEIVGPANIILVDGNRVDEPRLPICDAVALSQDASPNNAYAFTNCTFRKCSFQRVTFFITQRELAGASKIEWLNWVSPLPQTLLTQAEYQSHQSPQETE